MASVPFQTDYSRPASLASARLGASARARQTAAVTTSGQLAASASGPLTHLDGTDADSLTEDEYLDKLEEKVNKAIDDDIESLLDGFQQLVLLSSIKDKDKVQIAQDAFQSDVKADTMVRSAQSLSLLSSSITLSLLLAQSPDPSLDDEARELIEETEKEKRRCRELINQLAGIQPRSDILEKEESSIELSKQGGTKAQGTTAAGLGAQGSSTTTEPAQNDELPKSVAEPEPGGVGEEDEDFEMDEVEV